MQKEIYENVFEKKEQIRKRDESEKVVEQYCGLFIVKDNKVLFVNKDNQLSFPVVTYTDYRYTNILHNYGLKAKEPSKNLGVYKVGDQFQFEVFGIDTEVKDENEYNSLLKNSSISFIDMNAVEEYLCTNITLDEHRNQNDQMIIKSINVFKGIKEEPKQMKLVLTGN